MHYLADPDRIDRFLNELGTIGRDPDGGWSRVAFGAAEREAHELVSAWMVGYGFATTLDAIGNTYADVPGDTHGPMLLMGSHLDTVPNGGNFDGAAGVAAAIEAARLVSLRGGLRRPVRVVVFRGEEGARFGAPCIGSRVVTGDFTSETLEGLRDRDGRSVGQCARDLGLEPSAAAEAVWPSGSTGVFLELHIEQGRVLEDRNRRLGVVHTIGGSTRLEMTFVGQQDHSGATPMRLRKDALVGASEFILEVERLAATHLTTVGTVGRMQIGSGQGSLTTVPGKVTLGLDVRDIDPERQRDLAEAALEAGLRITGRRGLELFAELLSDQSPVILHGVVQDVLARTAESLGIPFMVMASGASHDAAHIAKVAPTGMLFVPCRAGVSHAKDEWSDSKDIAAGATVMAAALAQFQDLELA
jgi:hydantoinase/carbamoylase family amidase